MPLTFVITSSAVSRSFAPGSLLFGLVCSKHFPLVFFDGVLQVLRQSLGRLAAAAPV